MALNIGSIQVVFCIMHLWKNVFDVLTVFAVFLASGVSWSDKAAVDAMMCLPVFSLVLSMLHLDLFKMSLSLLFLLIFLFSLVTLVCFVTMHVFQCPFCNVKIVCFICLGVAVHVFPYSFSMVTYNKRMAAIAFHLIISF